MLAVALLEASVSMAGTMEATLLVVVDNIYGRQWYRFVFMVTCNE